MQRKYIHYERPDIAGLYYREGNVYFENLDSKNGKIVRIIFPGQGRARDLVKKNLWSQNQIDNKKEGKLITQESATGAPCQSWTAARAVDWAKAKAGSQYRQLFKIEI